MSILGKYKSWFFSSSKIFMGDMGNAILLFIQGIFIVRCLGPNEYGNLGIIQSYVYLLQSFLGFRTTDVLTKSIVHDNKDNVHQIIAISFFLDLFVNLFTIALVCISTNLFLCQYWRIEFNSFLIFSLILVFNSINSIWFSLNRNFKQYNVLSITPFVFTFIQVAIVISLILAKIFTLKIFLIVMLLISILQFYYKATQLNKLSMVSYNITLKAILTKINIIRIFERKEYWNFMCSTYFATLLSSMVKNGDTIILSVFQPNSAVGYYKLAKSLVSMLQTVVKSLTVVVYQDFTERIHKLESKLLFQELKIISKVWVPASIVGIILINILAVHFIPLFYGDKYWNAVLPFVILSLSGAVAISTFWAQPILFAIGGHKDYMKIISIYSICTLPLLFLSSFSKDLNLFCITWAVAWASVHIFLTLSSIKHMRNN